MTNQINARRNGFYRNAEGETIYLSDIVPMSDSDAFTQGFRYKDTAGMLYRKDGTTFFGGDQDLIEDLNVDRDPKYIHLNFETFTQNQMGRGCVAFSLSDKQRKNGEYDPNIAFVHHMSESEDPVILEQVTKDCTDLARLLNQFGTQPSVVYDWVKECAVVPAPHEGPSTEESLEHRIGRLEEQLRATRKLVSQCALHGFVGEAPIEELYRNNGAISRLVPVRSEDLAVVELQ